VDLSQWKKAIRERAGGKCERCGRPEDERPNGRGTYRHHCHHKDRDRTNNTLENGEYLCGDCHDEEHGGRGNITARDAAQRAYVESGFTEDTRRKISESQHRRFEDPAERERTAKKSQAQMADPAQREKQRLTHLGKKQTAEANRKRSETLRARGGCQPGCTCGLHSQSDEHKRKNKAGVTASWAPGGAKRVAFEQRQAVRESSETGPVSPDG
jgi:hypothetical protein